jgi:peroxiredoxin/tetratricopeptide (TPR) repeat protein
MTPDRTLILRLRTRACVFAGFALAALIAAAPWASPAAAAGKRLTNSELQEFNEACGDSSRAEWAIARLRNFLVSDPDSAYAFFARRMIVRAMVTIHAPPREVVLAADTTASLLPGDLRNQVFFYGELAQTLLDMGGEYPRALEYAHRAYAAVPTDDQYAPLRAALLAVLGRAQMMTGHPDSAVTSLHMAMIAAPDTQTVLLRLGQAYEKSNKTDLAINAYLRSAGVYMSKDTSAMGPLRALWKKRKGSLAGLDAKLDEVRAGSRKRIAFDGRREDRPAPPWTLSDLAGNPVESASFKGKVVVMDFWGSWCGPCRTELPIFQAMYNRFKDRGVVFLGMNFERPVPGKDLKQLARDFIEQNRYTFPVILDHDHIASDAYGIQGFPTVFLIDKKGTIRYKNVGVSEGIEMILADQIESLLN